MRNAPDSRSAALPHLAPNQRCQSCSPGGECTSFRELETISMVSKHACAGGAFKFSMVGEAVCASRPGRARQRCEPDIVIFLGLASAGSGQTYGFSKAVLGETDYCLLGSVSDLGWLWKLPESCRAPVRPGLHRTSPVSQRTALRTIPPGVRALWALGLWLVERGPELLSWSLLCCSLAGLVRWALTCTAKQGHHNKGTVRGYWKGPGPRRWVPK